MKRFQKQIKQNEGENTGKRQGGGHEDKKSRRKRKAENRRRTEINTGKNEITKDEINRKKESTR